MFFIKIFMLSYFGFYFCAFIFIWRLNKWSKISRRKNGGPVQYSQYPVKQPKLWLFVIAAVFILLLTAFLTLYFMGVIQFGNGAGVPYVIKRAIGLTQLPNDRIMVFEDGKKVILDENVSSVTQAYDASVLYYLKKNAQDETQEDLYYCTKDDLKAKEKIADSVIFYNCSNSGRAPFLYDRNAAARR